MLLVDDYCALDLRSIPWIAWNHLLPRHFSIREAFTEGTVPLVREPESIF
jgi:hypothetical protein